MRCMISAAMIFLMLQLCLPAAEIDDYIPGPRPPKSVTLSDFTATSSAATLSDETLDALVKTSQVVALVRLQNVEGQAMLDGKPFTGRALICVGGGSFPKLFVNGMRLEEIPDKHGKALFRQIMEDDWHDERKLAFRTWIQEHPLGHDEFIVFFRTQYGEPEDIPRLILALTKMRVLPGGAMICTRKHCLDALRHITGVDQGPTAEAWLSWYAKEMGMELSDEE